MRDPAPYSPEPEPIPLPRPQPPLPPRPPPQPRPQPRPCPCPRPHPHPRPCPTRCATRHEHGRRLSSCTEVLVPAPTGRLCLPPAWKAGARDDSLAPGCERRAILEARDRKARLRRAAVDASQERLARPKRDDLAAAVPACSLDARLETTPCVPRAAPTAARLRRASPVTRTQPCRRAPNWEAFFLQCPGIHAGAHKVVAGPGCASRGARAWARARARAWA
jgi:hypothetical protein